MYCRIGSTYESCSAGVNEYFCRIGGDDSRSEINRDNWWTLFIFCSSYISFKIDRDDDWWTPFIFCSFCIFSEIDRDNDWWTPIISCTFSSYSTFPFSFPNSRLTDAFSESRSWCTVPMLTTLEEILAFLKTACLVYQ